MLGCLESPGNLGRSQSCHCRTHLEPQKNDNKKHQKSPQNNNNNKKKNQNKQTNKPNPPKESQRNWLKQSLGEAEVSMLSVTTTSVPPEQLSRDPLEPSGFSHARPHLAGL